ncbi:MAG TPA: tRNA pseudouridine(38-40) synthase TruA [Lachnospiraceae bacterium]|nr:tRNA pseudouridine(38-40) synthase TruA [Lachnospiraceae bacterium]
MKRFMLTIAYDGTAYSGFQIQKSCRTIEGEIKRCLSELLGEEVHIIGGSRTDAGVHALCNVAVFDSGTNIPAEKLSYAINQRLPGDIRIMNSKEVPDDFHPRHCDTRKTYEYRIARGEFPVPTKRLYSYFTYHKLDLDKMQKAATFLEGEHDFKSFCAAAAVVESTVRTIYSITVSEENEDVVIQVCGNGFLYNMVRIIVGTLMDTGKGKWEPEGIRDILNLRDRKAAGPTAPACGLTLIKYEFEG